MFVSCSMWERLCVETFCCEGSKTVERFKGVRSAESGARFPSQICAELNILRNIDKVAKRLHCPLSDVMQQKSHFKKHVLSFGRFISIAPALLAGLCPSTHAHIACHVMWLFDVHHMTHEYRKSGSNPVLWKKNFLKLPPQVSHFFFSVWTLLKLTCFH